MIFYDVETTGLQPWSGKQRAFMYQFADDESAVEVLDPDVETDRARIQHWFDRGKEEGICAHNSKFDYAFGHVGGFDMPGDGCWHDSMIVAHAIDERRSVALKSVANEVLGAGSDDLQQSVKTWLNEEANRRRKDSKENGTELILPDYSDVPRGLMSEYAAEDVLLTRSIMNIYGPMLDRAPDLKKVVEFERDVLDALWHVERRGFPVDEHGYRMLEHEAVESVERLESFACELAAVGVEPDDLEDFEFNPRSSKQILDALKRRGADLTYVTNGSMDAENLGTVSDALAAAILEFRAEYKALTTYIRPMIGRSYETAMRMYKEAFISPDGRVHANYRQLGARTGRMSCSDPNIQNQPRDDLRLRYNFRAEPGHKLVACDLSNIEMRVFAAYAGEGPLLQAIRNGDDLHAKTAAGVGLRDQTRAGGTVTSARQRGKEMNFQIIYGGGIRTIRKTQRCSQDEARLILRRYHDTYPEVKKLQNRIEWALDDRGYISARVTSGRRFRLSDQEAFKGVNYLIQGTSADVLKAALVRLHKEGVPVVACVHDEIVAHVPEKDAKEAKHLIERALTDHPQITEKVPLEAEGDIIDRWSDAKPLKDGSLFKPNWAS